MLGVRHADAARQARVAGFLSSVVLVGLASGCAAGNAMVSPSHGAALANQPSAHRPLVGALPDRKELSCVTGYTPDAVATRSFAFDGTVRAIGAGTTDHPGDRTGYVTVHEWFRGGRAAHATVDMAPPQATVSELRVAGARYGIGSRLLVSGEPRWGGPALRDAVAWGCGFTRYYDPHTASSWRQATR